MDKAVEIARQFKNSPVTIVGDYDADGVTSTSILYLAFKWAGFTDVRYRIPKRFSEGYGISRSIIDEIRDGLLITCDNGIAQLDAIKLAKEKGLKIIILDHHLPAVIDGKDVLPDADAVIDPNALAGTADFSGYCGAGLSYKFARMLLDGNKTQCRKLLNFAAIGTVADVMELRQENYVFVREGLKSLVRSDYCTAGLYALISAFSLTSHISSYDIGYKLGPAINAASRMKDDGAMIAVRLLTYEGDYSSAVQMAEELVCLNESRKAEKSAGLKAAHEAIERDCLFGDIPMVVYVQGVGEGIIGILAGNLCEEFKVPVIVLTDASEGILKGSGRSYGNYDMKAQLDLCSSLLITHGGHVGAAGLSLRKENVELFRSQLMSNASDYEASSESDTYYDLEIKATEIPSFIEQISRFEPFGEGNPSIVFKINGFSVVPRYGSFKKLMGADESIVKLFSSSCTAIGFDMAERMRGIDEPKILDMVGVLSDNYFNGSVEHQIEFTDFKEAATAKVETPLASMLRSMAMSR